METTSYIALSRQAALWRQMDTVANNLANMNTPSFKGEHMMFRDYVIKARAADRPFGDKMSFVQDVSVYRDMSEGAMTHTGNPLDVAVRGDGFMVIDTPQGARYTRNGHFKLDESGQMVTADGFPALSNSDQPFFFAPNEQNVTIAADGTVSTENGQVGKLRVVRFENPQDLRKTSGGLFQTEAQPQDVDKPQVVQGMIEESNVKPIVEVTKMIEVQRSYDAVQRMIDSESDRVRKAIDVLGRTSR
ncbi:MAG: flagellar basal-body rod protein FlgF [Alphaproteobacteria bacterium]|nr:flagellar basal-body rod protein FlgF [Alphaproteobacteria bacterium]